MAKLISIITGKSSNIVAVVGRVILWSLLLVVLMKKVIPLIPYSLNFMSRSFLTICSMIKQRPFIYIIFNFIIIFIIICSSSFTTKLNSLLQKLQRTSSHNISSLISQTSRKLSLSWDDDSWWHKMVNNEEIQHFPPLDESYGETKEEEEEETVSFPPRGVEKRQEVKKVEEDHNITHISEAEEQNYNNDDDYVVEREVEEECDNDTLDDTWKAIMEAKKNGGPYLKKSGTWTSGDRGVGGGTVAQKKGMGRLARCKAGLKKWSTFSKDVVQEKNDYRGGRGGGGLKKEVGLTYNDELKKRSDDFIARFTNDMRLQRLESNQRFLEISNRGL